MRICLTGVPGAGKTALAEALEEYYVKNDDCECRTPVHVIDDYASEAGNNVDLAVSFEGSYLANIAVAMERLGRERNASGKTIITCGSLIETSTYMAMEFESRARFWTTDDEKGENAKRMQAGLSMLACLYMDSFHYGRVYYLPPFKANPEDGRLKVMDKNLQAAFQAFMLTDTKALIAEGDSLEEITANRVKMIAEEDESGVPDGDGEDTATEAVEQR